MYQRGFGTPSISEMLESIKPKINAMDILEHYGADNISEAGSELIHSCIVDKVDPHHSHGDSSPGASLNSETLLWNCFSYGGLDILGLIMKMESCDAQDALRFLGSFIQGDIPTENFLQEIEQYLDKRIEPLILPTYSDKLLDSWINESSHLYFLNRGISKSVCQDMKLGYDPEEKRVVIPHFWKGDLVGWQKRTIKPAILPKYRNSTHFPKRYTLYNWDNINPHHPVIVVESPMSVLYGKSIGLTNITATFGSSVSREQLQYLGLCDTIVVFFDPDKAGEHGTNEIVDGLIHVTNVKVVNNLPKGKDFADLPLEQILNYLDDAKPAALLGVN